MKKITEMVHEVLQQYISEDSICIDFTLGQGYDTKFFASRCKKVYAFDLQQEAVDYASTQLNEEKAEVQLFVCGHENFDQYVKERFDAGVFNFGYFPLGNHAVTTKLNTSKMAVEKALKQLKKHGVLVLVLYLGHEEGEKESVFFDEYCAKLPSKYYATMKVQMLNKQKAPYFIVIEKLKLEEGHDTK